MSNDEQVLPMTNRVLVKLRQSSALRAAEFRENLRPLYDMPQATRAALSLDLGPQWFVAELRDGAATPWDLAHARVAEQLGVSDSDVIFAEPDIVHKIYADTNEQDADQPFAVGSNCQDVSQDGTHGKAPGPNEFAWHLATTSRNLAKRGLQ